MRERTYLFTAPTRRASALSSTTPGYENQARSKAAVYERLHWGLSNALMNGSPPPRSPARDAPPSSAVCPDSGPGSNAGDTGTLNSDNLLESRLQAADRRRPPEGGTPTDSDLEPGRGSSLALDGADTNPKRQRGIRPRSSAFNPGHRVSCGVSYEPPTSKSAKAGGVCICCGVNSGGPVKYKPFIDAMISRATAFRSSSSRASRSFCSFRARRFIPDDIFFAIRRSTPPGEAWASTQAEAGPSPLSAADGWPPNPPSRPCGGGAAAGGGGGYASG